MIVFSLVMVAFGIDKGLVPFFASVSLAASTFIGSFLLGKGIGRKALIVGLAYSLIIYLIVSITAAVIGGGGFSLSSFFNLLIILLSSFVGTVFGTNSKNKRKI